MATVSLFFLVQRREICRDSICMQILPMQLNKVYYRTCTYDSGLVSAWLRKFQGKVVRECVETGVIFFSRPSGNSWRWLFREIYDQPERKSRKFFVVSGHQLLGVFRDRKFRNSSVLDLENYSIFQEFLMLRCFELSKLIENLCARILLVFEGFFNMVNKFRLLVSSTVMNLRNFQQTRIPDLKYSHICRLEYFKC